MDSNETEVASTENQPVNGAATVPPKPWIAAGFKTRDEWRASKKAPKGDTVAKKKPTKAKKTAKVKAAAKPAKSSKGPKAPRKYKPQRTEPSELQMKLLKAFGGIGEKGILSELGEKAFKDAPAKKRFSWARNNIRWLFANGFVKHTAPGEYQRAK